LPARGPDTMRNTYPISECALESSPRERILVVDDEIQILSLCKEFLEDIGFRVEVAHNAYEAMEQFDPGKYQLVITDINMPEMSGVELMRWIKGREPELPVIILTGYGTYTLMHEALRDGVSDFVDKPFSLQDLEQSILRALEMRAVLAERERVRVMKRLIAGSERLAREMEEHSLLEFLLDFLSTETGAGSISVMLPDESGNMDVLRIAHSRGIPDKLKAKAQETESPIARTVFRERKAICVRDLRTDGRFGTPTHDRYGSYSFLSVPMVVSDRVAGVINLTDKAEGKVFTQADEEVATVLANQAAIALERSRLYSQLQAKVEEVESIFYGTVQAISNAIDAKSTWTKGHSERVTIYSGIIGRALQLSDADMETLKLAALLHDVGKIGTYDTVLDKPSRLTSDEYELVKLHPVKGEEILRPIERLQHILPIIRHHHERFDGKGYPDGLGGESIPYLARILTVADTFDSMTSKRPYRETPGRDRGIDELRRCSGSQFDSDIVEAFCLGLSYSAAETGDPSPV